MQARGLKFAQTAWFPRPYRAALYPGLIHLANPCERAAQV